MVIAFLEVLTQSLRFFKLGVLNYLAIFTEKQLCWSLFLIKLTHKKNFLIKTPTQVFSCVYCEILKNNFFYRTPVVAASGKNNSCQYLLFEYLKTSLTHCSNTLRGTFCNEKQQFYLNNFMPMEYLREKAKGKVIDL